MSRFKDFVKQNKREIALNALVLLLTVAVVTGVFVYWGNHKIMWFCDEIYSYFTANSGSGLGPRITYQTWYDGSFVVDDMSPEAGQFFRRTINNVKVDDHPPVYFLTMHAASLVAGRSISKWIGLSVNLICVIGICIFAYFIFYMITRKKWAAFASAVALCLLPSMLTNGMLIRMYCMMTAWAMLYIFLSYLVMQENINKWLKLFLHLALAGTTAFGFLTQYYFAVFAVGFTAVYTIYCVIRKWWKKLACYIVSMILAVGIATVLWEEWIDQIFYRYCGEEVMSKAGDFSNLLHELFIGLTYLPKLMFYKFWILGCVLVIAGLIFLVLKKNKNLPIIAMLLGGAFFYSIIIAHVTPSFYLDYRYFYMAAVIAYMAVLIIFISCSEYLVNDNLKRYAVYVIPGFFVIFNVLVAQFDETSMGYIDRTGEYHEKIAALKEYGTIPWVYYGYENWTMMENYYDFPLCEKFIVYNDMFDFEGCPGEGQDFLFMLDTRWYKDGADDAVLEKLKDVVGCNHEIEFLFSKGSEIYLIRHNHDGEIAEQIPVK